jgi:hypothetical protein
MNGNQPAARKAGKNYHEDPATEKQAAYLVALAAKKTPHVSADAIRTWCGTISKAQASEKINELKAMPTPVGVEATAAKILRDVNKPEPVDGIYYVEGTNEIFKVYCMVHGSGRQGVKRLEHNLEAGTGKFAYMGLAAKHLPSNAVLMPLAEAMAFGKMYGFCVRCGRTLTDEGSIAAGIGPVCAGKWHTAPAIEVPEANGCTPGQKCTTIDDLCSKHQAQYQAQWGRASNE